MSALKWQYRFSGGEMAAGGSVRSFGLRKLAGGTAKSFNFGELHINRGPSLGLGRRGPLSWISSGLHILVDGEAHRWFSSPFEFVRNTAVDLAEAGYTVRGNYVY